MSERPRTEKATRQGRGRLSSLDMLPDEAEADLVWLNEELRAAKRPQIELLDEFNARLLARGLEPISKSAFSRYSVRLATQFRQLDETRRISADLAGMLGADSADSMTIALSEMLKMAAFKLAEGGKLAAKDVMELARANKDAVGAQKLSADYRRRLEEEASKRLARTLDEVEGGMAAGGGAAGLDGATVLRLIREAHGIA